MSLPLPARNIRNRDIMLRALEGQSIEMIAELYDLAPSTVKNILESPLVVQSMTRLQAELARDIVSKVKERSHEALETVTDVMRGEVNSKLRFDAAKDILDRNPDLQPKKDEGLSAIGAGMGEWLVRELARKRNERAEEPTDVSGSSDDATGCSHGALPPAADPSEGQ